MFRESSSQTSMRQIVLYVLLFTITALASCVPSTETEEIRVTSELAENVVATSILEPSATVVQTVPPTEPVTEPTAAKTATPSSLTESDLTRSENASASELDYAPRFVALQICRTEIDEEGSRPITSCSVEIRDARLETILFSHDETDSSYTQPVFSPSAKWLAYVETAAGRSRLRLVDTNWQEDMPLTDWYETNEIRSIHWSGSEQNIAFKVVDWGGNSESLHAVSIERKTATTITDNAGTYTWLREGQDALLFIPAEEDLSFERLSLWQNGDAEPQTYAVLVEGEGPFAEAWALASDSKGHRIAFCGARTGAGTGLWTLETETQQWQQVASLGGYACLDLDWSPDDSVLSVVTDTDLLLFDAQDWNRNYSLQAGSSRDEDRAVITAKWADDMWLAFAFTRLYPGPSFTEYQLELVSSDGSRLLNWLDFQLEEVSTEDYDQILHVTWP